MPRVSGPTVEVETLEDFDKLVAGGATSMRSWRVQGVDLRARTDQLLQLAPQGAILLGCPVGGQAEGHLRAGGALLFPSIPELPFNPYRGGLYSPEELYDGLDAGHYELTPDALIYAWTREPGDDLARALARALHDHAIDDALDERLLDRRVVGVMGGHAVSRTGRRYAEAARFGHRVARASLMVATGGGPGDMEAANLGAYLSRHPDSVVEEALAAVAAAPTFQPSVEVWARTALEVRRRWSEGTESVGIPTWFYGHEPPNVFASSIAKYFQNSLREATLLRHCDAGIVFLPGAAGTVQEIFQDACENYYANPDMLAPMVLVGERYWTEEMPVWPLLKRLANDRPMAAAVHLVDDIDEAAAVVAG